MNIRWSPTSVEDLESLRAYIAEHDPTAAARVAKAIVEVIENLRRFPAMGRSGRVPHTRELVIPGTPCLVPYTVTGRTIEIIAVLHAARRWPSETPLTSLAGAEP